MATAAEFDIDAELEAERKAEQERLLRLQQELAALDQPASKVESTNLGRYYGYQPPLPDKYAVYQSWLNTLNPDTAAQGRQELAALGVDTADPYNNAPPVQVNPANEVAAIRLRGSNGYREAVKAGVPPAQAFAQYAGDLFYNDPASLTKALPALSRITSPKIAPPAKVVAPKMPQDVIDQRKIINDEIRAMQGGMFGVTEEDKPKLESLRNRYLELGTNWIPKVQASTNLTSPVPFQTQTFTESGPEGLAMRQVPVARVAPASQPDEVVAVIAPNGKRGTMKKSDFERAKKNNAGYKLK